MVRNRLFAIACAAGTALAAAASVRADPMPPEDPVAGAKSTQQWREHMAHEEHERKLHYDGDRNRMKDHRVVVKFLVATRARYDRAKTKAAVLSIQKRLPPAVDGVRKRITKIDQWGTNSNLLGDYDAMLKALSDTYPAARITSLEGDPAPLAALKADLDRRTKHIDDWLAEAARAQDE